MHLVFQTDVGVIEWLSAVAGEEKTYMTVAKKNNTPSMDVLVMIKNKWEFAVILNHGKCALLCFCWVTKFNEFKGPFLEVSHWILLQSPQNMLHEGVSRCSLSRHQEVLTPQPLLVGDFNSMETY